MKNKDILILKQGLTMVSGLVGIKFAYGCAKNNSIIQGELEALDKAKEPTKEFAEYDEKRYELAKKHAKKDKDGNPLSENNSLIMENQEEWEKIFSDFKKDYTEVIAQREKQVEEYNKLLEEEVDVKLYQISLEDVPKEITTGQLLVIYPIIKE